MVFLLEAYNMAPSESMNLPSSRRHRLVKIREEIVRSGGKGRGGGQTPSYSTGLDGRPPRSGPADPNAPLGSNWSV